MNDIDVALFAATVAEEAKEAGLPAAASSTTSALTALFLKGVEGYLEDQVLDPLHALIAGGEYDGMRWEVDDDGVGHQLYVPQWGYLRSNVKYPLGSDFVFIPEK